MRKLPRTVCARNSRSRNGRQRRNFPPCASPCSCRRPPSHRLERDGLRLAQSVAFRVMCRRLSRERSAPGRRQGHKEGAGTENVPASPHPLPAGPADTRPSVCRRKRNGPPLAWYSLRLKLQAVFRFTAAAAGPSLWIGFRPPRASGVFVPQQWKTGLFLQGKLHFSLRTADPGQGSNREENRPAPPGTLRGPFTPSGRQRGGNRLPAFLRGDIMTAPGGAGGGTVSGRRPGVRVPLRGALRTVSGFLRVPARIRFQVAVIDRDTKTRSQSSQGLPQIAAA